MRKYLLFLLLLCFSAPAFAAPPVPNYKSWPVHAKDSEPRIEAPMVAELLASGEKMLLIYAGYEDAPVICGSLFIPYTFTPPFGNGANVNLPDVPKDTLMISY